MINYGYNPLRDFENIAKEIGRAISESQKPASRHDNAHEDRAANFKPRTDVLEDNEKVYIQMELPGVSKEQVKITVNSDLILTISGNKPKNIPEGVNLCCRNERIFGDFRRSFQLPDTVDADRINAKYDAGMLYITISKKVEVMPKENIVNID